MKVFMPAVVVTVLVFSSLLIVIAVAQSPREQLQQLTIQLQRTPNDHALRERIMARENVDGPHMWHTGEHSRRLLKKAVQQGRSE